jgi:hypothetical protein
MNEEETCIWCHLGVSREDEQVVITESGLVFHKRCFEQFKKEALRASELTIEELHIIWLANKKLQRQFPKFVDYLTYMDDKFRKRGEQNERKQKP